MRKQQPTPVDTGTKSTDAGAVQAAIDNAEVGG